MNLSKSFKHGSRGRSTLDSLVARNWGKVSKSSLPLPSALPLQTQLQSLPRDALGACWNSAPTGLIQGETRWHSSRPFPALCVGSKRGDQTRMRQSWTILQVSSPLQKEAPQEEIPLNSSSGGKKQHGLDTTCAILATDPTQSFW